MSNVPLLDTAIDRAIDPTGVMQRVVDQTLGLVPSADGVSIGLKEGEGLTCVCGGGQPAHGRWAFTSTDREPGRAGHAATARFFIPTTRRPTHGPIPASRTTSASPRWYACHSPLSRPIGVLYVSSSRTNAFVDERRGGAAARGRVLGHRHRQCAGLRPRNPRIARRSRPGHSNGDDRGRCRRAVHRQHHRSRASRAVWRPNSGFRGCSTANCYRWCFSPSSSSVRRQVLGVEALARFATDPIRSPDVWFAEAHRVGMGADLELAAIRAALTELAELPPHPLPRRSMWDRRCWCPGRSPGCCTLSTPAGSSSS